MKKGFALLLSIIIFAAVGVAISTTLLLLSINSTATAGVMQDSQQAKGIANACAETSLQKLVTSSSYLGTGNLTLGNGTCSYTVSTLDASNDVIKISGTVGSTTRKIQIKLPTATLLISSWQEVGDFS